MATLAESFRRVAGEYEEATEDSVRRHFLVQFISSELRQLLLGLAEEPRRYRVRMPNYSRTWPSMPWFALAPRMAVVGDRIFPGAIFVLEPSARLAHVVGELAIPIDSDLPEGIAIANFTTSSPSAKILEVLEEAQRRRAFRASVFTARALPTLDDAQLRADVRTIQAQQRRAEGILQFSAADWVALTVKALGPALGQTSEERAQKTTEQNQELYPVWYCTSRKPTSPFVGPHWYTSVREQADKVHYGVCMAAIPKTHRFGAKPSPWWKKLLRVDSQSLFLESVQALSPMEFWSSALEGLDAMGADENDALIYVHGFNTSFPESILRAAQLGHDLKFPGITTAFSWPSKGNLAPNSYAADNATIGAHCSYIAEFIAGLISRVECRKVHILGHSLGSLAVLKGCAGKSIFTKDQAKRIGQVIFAAADVDDQEFVKYAPRTPSIRTTLYASAKDAALKISSGWNSYKRAGLLPPPTVATGVDTVDVGGVDISAMGHGYVAEAHAVLYDMSTLFRHNTPPAQRIRLKQTSLGPLAYWKLV